VSDLLNEREQTHGRFEEVAYTARTIRYAMTRDGLSAVQEEALGMIASKLARITCGNPDEPDHWRDIAGYAELVVRDLRRESIARQANTVLGL
jgi:hypothetical protein